MERRRAFSLIVDGETVRDRFEPHEGPIRLDAWVGHVEIRDAVSGEIVATLPMMDLADLDEGPWITPVDLASGERMTLTVSATTPAEEDGLPELALLVRHETAHEADRAALVPARWFEPRIGLPAAILLVLLGFGAGVAVNELRSTDLRGPRIAPLQEPGADEPFSLKLSAVGQRRLQLAVTGKADTVGEVYVDWGDPTSPDPVGGTRVFRQAGGRGQVRPPPFVHDYPAAVGPEGLRTVARGRIIPVGLPARPPGTPSEAQLIPLQRLLVLPDGLVLDPRPPRLRIVAPEADEVVPALTEVRLKLDSITADVHLLGVDQRDRSVYYHLGSFPAPRFAKHTVAQVIDTARLGENGTFRVVAVSTNKIEGPVGALVPWHHIPAAAPFTEIELRHAGIIVAPTPGSSVSEAGIDTVRGKIFLPDRYAVVAVRPRKEGRYWIQNDPLAAYQFVEFAVQASFGGRDGYEIWLGITQDPHVFTAGERLEQLGRTDPDGRPIHWIGPVEVSRR